MSIDMCSIAIYALYCNLFSKHQIEEFISQFFCQLRGYLAHICFCSLAYSFVTQAFYRLVGAIYPHQLYFQSLQPYLYAILIQWIFSFLEVLPIIMTNNQVYIEHEFLCLIQMTNTCTIVYLCCVSYLLPLALIVIQYWIIVQFTKKRYDYDLYAYNTQRVHRQMILIRRILILIGTYLVLGLPYSSFILLEALSIRRAPPYAHRIGFMFMSIGSTSVILTMIHFTRSEQRRQEKQDQRKQLFKINETQPSDSIDVNNSLFR
ncbi:hypothetical protein I4U23_023057 [Adineta vaga]|nr:hypothetical protein I4U23_023057 [Adineta vaga]